MTSKKTIRKIFLFAVWLLVIGGLITLFVAANGKKEVRICRGVQVAIHGMGEKYFIGKSDILQVLSNNGGVKGKPVAAINLAQLEKRLEKNAWIKDAELYFDSRNVLYASVTERQPIARVFTTTGSSFYIDSSGARLPLLQRVSARVPVVTGFPAGKKLSKKDSALLRDVSALAQFISADAFWNAQVAQIDITANRRFEIVPTIGNHIVRLGTAEGVEEKLANLLLFYRQVLRRTGFDRYAVLDVQFKDQVVGVYEGERPADSIQNFTAQRSETLSPTMQNEAVEMNTQNTDNGNTFATQFDAATTSSDRSLSRKSEPKNPASMKTNGTKPVTEKRGEQKPKAVMKKRGDG